MLKYTKKYFLIIQKTIIKITIAVQHELGGTLWVLNIGNL